MSHLDATAAPVGRGDRRRGYPRLTACGRSRRRRRRRPASSAGPARSTGCSPETYPDAKCELDFDNPFELLVVTVLCAQTTDKRVNLVRPTLFAAYPDAQAMAAADRAELEQIVGPLGFFRAKTESLLKLSAALVERYDGEVPPRLDDLVTLPGVGRKTANVVLGNAFGIPGHHRRHPLRAARPPARLDRGDRPGQGRARDRRAVPQAGLDDALPPPDLARPAALPRPQSGVRCLPGRALVPVVR